MKLNDEGNAKKINAMLVFEAIGRPAEKLVEALEGLIKKIDEEKGVCVTFRKVHEPVEIKEQKNFFSNFAEVEVEVEEIMYLAMLMFKYMPAHVDIISPETIHLSNNGFNEIFNELTRRLHGYDEVARVIQTERMILEKKLRELMEQQKNPDGKIAENKSEEIIGEEEIKKGGLKEKIAGAEQNSAVERRGDVAREKKESKSEKKKRGKKN